MTKSQMTPNTRFPAVSFSVSLSWKSLVDWSSTRRWAGAWRGTPWESLCPPFRCHHPRDSLSCRRTWSRYAQWWIIKKRAESDEFYVIVRLARSSVVLNGVQLWCELGLRTRFRKKNNFSRIFWRIQLNDCSEMSAIQGVGGSPYWGDVSEPQ